MSLSAKHFLNLVRITQMVFVNGRVLFRSTTLLFIKNITLFAYKIDIVLSAIRVLLITPPPRL